MTIIAGILTGVLTIKELLIIPVFMILATVFLWLAGVFQVPQKDRIFLFRLAALALLLRVLFIVATHSFDTPFFNYFKASDAQYYEYMGRLISDAWNEGENYVVNKANYGYYYWNGLIYYLVGFKPDLVRVLNSVIAVCTGFNLYFISMRLSGEKAAKISFVLGAFFPSSFLWSSLNLKDSLIIFLITLIAKIYLQIIEKFSGGKVIFIALLLMALVSLRFYVGIILAMGITFSYIFSATRLSLWHRLLYTIFLFLIAGFVLKQMGYGFMGMEYLQTQNIETIGEQHEKAAYGNAAFAQEVTIRNLTDAIKYLPTGIFYFLFAPLPWQAIGPMRIISIPEMLFLYFSYGYLIIGFKQLWHTQRGACVFLLLVILSFGLIYSLGSANIGGLYRVRLQVIMLSFIFISEGLQRSWALTKIFKRITRGKALPGF